MARPTSCSTRCWTSASVIRSGALAEFGTVMPGAWRSGPRSRGRSREVVDNSTRTPVERHPWHMLTTRFTELVGCDVPIRQAQMGLVSPPGLALAVARAGGVGTVSVPIGVEPAALAAQLDGWLDASAGVLAVNFITEQVDPDAVAVAGARARMVDFFWNTPHTKLFDA